MKILSLHLAILLGSSFAAFAQTNVGAYFAFQNTSSDIGDDSAEYSTDLSLSTFPGTPAFSAGGTKLANFKNFGSDFTAFDASVWTPGRCVAWNVTGDPSNNNSWQVTLNTNGVTALAAEFKYRLNGVESAGSPVTSLAAFEYQIGGGSFQAVPGASLVLANNSNYNNTWTVDLSSLTAIENQSSVTLRWSLPDLDAVSGTQVRMDDLQITGVHAPNSLTWITGTNLAPGRVDDSYNESVEISSGTSPYTYTLKSGSALPAGLALSSSGNLAGTPTSAGSFTFTITADDSEIPANSAEREFVLAIARKRSLPEGNYNVLFIAVDDLKANFGPFGPVSVGPGMPDPITPHLDSLAANGMAFTRAHCQQATCWASRASLLLGVRPDTTKVWDINTEFRNMTPNAITLPQHFAGEGYTTAGIGKIFDSRSAPDNQDAALSWPDGFNEGNSPHSFFEDGHWQVEDATSTNTNNLFATDAGVTNFWETPNRPVEDDDYVDGVIATQGINKLQTFASDYTNTSQPFFLAVGFKKPHLPFVCPKTYWDLYDPAEIDLTGYDGTRTMPTGTLPFVGPYNEPASYGDINGGGGINSGPINITDARRLIHGYLATTSFVDAQIGRVLAALDASGVADNTIVVLWGDHGWQLGDHNGFWAKRTNFEQSTRVPLIIRAPGMATFGTAGKSCASPVELVDLFPTLVELASLPVPSQPTGLETQGTSLLPLLEDPVQAWKKGAFTQYQRFLRGAGVTNPGNGMGYSIRTNHYRYTEWWRTSTTATNAQGEITDRDVKLFGTYEHRELYDMKNDPGETVNLAEDPAYASLAADLSAALAGGYGWETTSVAAPANFPTDFPSWQASHVEPGYSLGDFAEIMDPDGDGILNLREYAHGTDPLSRDSDPLWSGVIGAAGARHLALEYPLVGSRMDVTTSSVMSADLTAWTTTGVIHENLGNEANRNLWRSKIPIEGSVPPSGFMRLNFAK